MTKAPVERDNQPKTWANKQRDRRRLWVQIMAGFLVLAMLLPIIIAFF